MTLIQGWDNSNNKNKELLEQLDRHEVPYTYGDALQGYDSYMLRDEVIKRQGFALIFKEWIEPFAKWIGNRKCLELMAGCGTLSKALQDEGVDITLLITSLGTHTGHMRTYGHM